MEPKNPATNPPRSPERRTKPATFADQAKQMLTSGAPRLTPEEEAAVEAEASPEGLGGADLPEDVAAQQAVEDEPNIPAWAKVPGDLVVPPWKTVGYLLFPPWLTGRPDLGDRTCVTWGLSVVDERLARQATRGDGTRTYEEMAKRMIRSIDGVKADWTGRKGHRGDVNKFWEEVGNKARLFLVNQYLQTHNPTTEETARFFLECVVYRSSVAG